MNASARFPGHSDTFLTSQLSMRCICRFVRGPPDEPLRVPSDPELQSQSHHAPEDLDFGLRGRVHVPAEVAAQDSCCDLRTPEMWPPPARVSAHVA